MQIPRIALVLAIVACAGSARAAILQYEALLSGPAESPPNASPGTGLATLDWDTVANTYKLDVTFSGLTGTTTASHIHAPTPDPGTKTAGVATTLPSFPGFPLGVTAGAYNNTFDLLLASTYNPAFVTANGGTPASAAAALLAAIQQGKAYLNIHSSTFPGGEIRGFFAPVPEPCALALLALGGAAIAAIGWRRRRL